VTKLAILANKWTHRRKGICVLSHTNTARSEIESRLSTCAAANALLRYPHFVGTIHSFVNEFLAIPWLRSCGYAVNVIDDEITLDIRWGAVPVGTRAFIQQQHRDKQCLTYDDPLFGGGPKRCWAEHTPTYQKLRQICEETSKRGFFCYDEMFVWASQVLSLRPQISDAIRMRFPLLFIDEVQDNSELQSALLHRLFSPNDPPGIRQRFGDSNQAIFQSTEQSGALADPFPGPNKVELPTSLRFGQSIADHADPLGVSPHGLIGCGPRRVSRRTFQNAIVLFDDTTILSVLAKYAAYLIGSFSEAELMEGTFTAVAAVHHRSDKEDK
jgi:DNA helicase II / ATP-dependent DNA helicase PcrA